MNTLNFQEKTQEIQKKFLTSILNCLYIGAMNNEMVEHLEKALRQIDFALESLRMELEIQQNNRNRLKNFIDEVKENIRTGAPTNSNLPGVFIYQKLSLKDAIIAILRREYPSSLKVREIQDILADGGYKTESKHLNGAIFSMLSRLVKLGLVEKVSTGTYRKK